MKTDILLSGVGGQGIITIAAIIGMAALHNNLNIKQSEIHGMSQRGGEVQSHLRISKNIIASDLIPYGHADLILSVEPMESLRYLPYLSSNGWLITNINPYINITDYPDIEIIIDKIKSIERYVALDADKMAKEIKSPLSSNIIMLGAASPFINMKFEFIEEALCSIFEKKSPEIVNNNLIALRTGYNYSIKNKSKIN